MSKVWILRVLGVACAYYVIGRLALLLAIPPGYATAVWPASGVALVGVLLFGYRIWPGVFLGSCLVNLFTSFNPTSVVSAIESTLPTLLIGGGASLQAVIGALLIRRFVGFPNPLNDEKAVIKFLFWGGPFGCLVGATIGVTGLCAFGIVPWSEYLFSWGTWWVGDTIGVIVVAPALIVSITDPGKIFSARRLSVVLPLLLILSMSVALFVQVSSWEQDRVQQEFQKRTERLARGLKKKLDIHLESIEAFESLYLSVSQIDRPTFQAFANDQLKRHPGILAYSWNLKIAGNQREVFEAKMRRSGSSNFVVTEQDARGKIVPTKYRSEHITPVYIEPMKFNETVIGYDLTSSAVRNEALIRARDTGQPSMSGKLNLIQEISDQSGLLLALPIYKKGVPNTTLAQKTKNLYGFVMGIFKINDLIEAALSEQDRKGIDVEIDDVTAAESQNIYLCPTMAKKKTEEQTNKPKNSRAGLHWDSKIDFAGRSWVIRFSQTHEFLVGNRSWEAWLVLVGALLFTGLLGAFLLVITGRASRIQALVVEKTNELSEQKGKLIAGSKMSALGEMASGMAHEINTPLTIIALNVSQLRSSIQEDNHFDRSRAIERTNMIESTTLRIAKIIKALRSFAREGHEDPFERVRLKNITDDTFSFCQERFKNRGIKFDHSEVPESFVMECRATDISQVILNLLNNAYDAVEPLEEKWIRIEAQDKGDSISITITDSGKGIPSHLHDKIMQPFFTTKPIGKGTGLGLSISRGIVESHNGTLELDLSSPHTRFVITLPKRQNQSMEASI